MTRTIARPRPALDPAVAAAFVRKCESGHTARMAALLALGLPLCLLGPLFITVIVWMYGSRNLDSFSFTSTFLLVTAVSLPFLFLLAATLQGSVIEAGAETIDPGNFLGGQFAFRRAALPLLVMEIGNIGPRMVLHIFRRTTARRRAGRVPPDRLATALCTLAAAGGTLPPAKLLLPSEPAAALEPLLAILLFHDLADISKTGDRIWLTSPTRTKLGIPTH